jgi:hypothetical protein
MDQHTLDNAFTPAKHLNVIADLMLGKNLQEHKATVASSIEAADFIIEQEGYRSPDIALMLEMKSYFVEMHGHIEKSIADPSYRIDISPIK